MRVTNGAADRPTPLGPADRDDGVGAALRRGLVAAVPAPLFLVALAVGACAHHPPGEFDVARPVAEERLPAPGPAAANLSGTWELDARASGGQGGTARGGGGRGGGFRGRGGMPGGGGDFGGMPPGEGDRAGRGREGGQGRRPEGGDSAMAGPRRLVLTQSDSSLAIARQGAAPLTLYFDGRTVYAPDPRGEGRVETNGRWHAKRFEVRRRLEEGRTVTESYELSKDGNTLTVRTGSSSFEVRRVYRRVPEGSPTGGATPPPGGGA